MTLQGMAYKRGLTGISNDWVSMIASKARGHAVADSPRSRRGVYLGWAEKEIMR